MNSGHRGYWEDHYTPQELMEMADTEEIPMLDPDRLRTWEMVQKLERRFGFQLTLVITHMLKKEVETSNFNFVELSAMVLEEWE